MFLSMTNNTSSETLQAIITAYQNGDSLRDIAARVKADKRTISRLLKQAGVAVRAKCGHQTIEFNQQVVDDFLAGESIIPIAEKHNISVYAVLRMLKQADVSDKQRGSAQRQLWFKTVEENPESIIERYKGGETLEAIAASYDVAVITVYKFLKPVTQMRPVGAQRKRKDGFLFCNKCSSWKKPDDFSISRVGYMGKCTYCRSCGLNSYRIRNYGVDQDEYNRLLAVQGGVCAICGSPPVSKRNDRKQNLNVDHCHTTGKVRGLLCSRCNVAVGTMYDQPDLFRKAADYLRASLDGHKTAS